jgi:hypothetical protein
MYRRGKQCQTKFLNQSGMKYTGERAVVVNVK